MSTGLFKLSLVTNNSVKEANALYKKAKGDFKELWLLVDVEGVDRESSARILTKNHRIDLDFDGVVFDAKELPKGSVFGVRSGQREGSPKPGGPRGKEKVSQLSKAKASAKRTSRKPKG